MSRRMSPSDPNMTKYSQNGPKFLKMAKKNCKKKCKSGMVYGVLINWTERENQK